MLEQFNKNWERKDKERKTTEQFGGRREGGRRGSRKSERWCTDVV